MIIKVDKTWTVAQWLQQRHQNWHANRPRGWRVLVDGCEECLLEIIWEQNPEMVEGICQFHDQFHSNILKNEYHLATHESGQGQLVFGWFKACSRCIDSVFTAGTPLAKKRFS